MGSLPWQIQDITIFLQYKSLSSVLVKQSDGLFKVHLMSSIPVFVNIWLEQASQYCSTSCPYWLRHWPDSAKWWTESLESFPQWQLFTEDEMTPELSPTFSQNLRSQWEEKRQGLWPMRHNQDSLLCPQPGSKRKRQKKCESFFRKLRVRRERGNRTGADSCNGELSREARVTVRPDEPSFYSTSSRYGTFVTSTRASYWHQMLWLNFLLVLMVLWSIEC